MLKYQWADMDYAYKLFFLILYNRTERGKILFVNLIGGMDKIMEQEGRYMERYCGLRRFSDEMGCYTFADRREQKKSSREEASLLSAIFSMDGYFIKTDVGYGFYYRETPTGFLDFLTAHAAAFTTTKENAAMYQAALEPGADLDEIFKDFEDRYTETNGTGAVVCLLTAVIVFGGMKRMVAVTEKFVPFMAILYIGGAVAVIALNAEHLGEAFGSIFAGAFSLRAAGSGAAGYVIARAMRYGFARGVFSNEAGLGSSVMVHSCSDVKEPVKQGLWGVFEVFFDTIVICSLTALTVLCTGAHNVEGLEGIDVTIYAFQSALGPFGGYLVSVGLVLFAFSTLLGWTVYGGRAAGYLGGKRFTAVYRVVFLATVFLGSVSSVQLVWDLSDTFNGLMALPNLIGVLFLSPLVFRITKNYTRRVFGGEQISPLLSYSQPDAPQRTARARQKTEK